MWPFRRDEPGIIDRIGVVIALIVGSGIGVLLVWAVSLKQ